jgi:HPt (histidine-containing phosphotransfer) domain-containing protein
MRELVTIFRADAPMHRSRIQRALGGHDAEAIWLAAHALKGAAGTINALPVFRAAAQLEDAGRRSDLAAAPPLAEELFSEMSRLDAALVHVGGASRTKKSHATGARTRARAKKGHRHAHARHAKSSGRRR